MDLEQEKRLLEGLLEAMDTGGKKRRGWRFWLISAVLWLTTAAVFFAVFRYGSPPHWPHYLLASTGFILGIAFSYDFSSYLFQQQWPMVARYIDREQVEYRLAELRA